MSEGQNLYPTMQGHDLISVSTKSENTFLE